jgi:DNA-binding response OmpR family regulator
MGVVVSLVISDIRMPGMSGLDVLRRIRSLSLDAPVLLISAFCDEETLDEASHSGAAIVMSKPFELEGLLTVAEFLLARVSDSDD